MKRQVSALELPVEIEEAIATFAGDLVDYQCEDYATRYLRLIRRTLPIRSPDFTAAVGRSFHKLMAYKDEYEVARLMLHPDGLEPSTSVGEGPVWHLQPPILKALGMDSKIEVSSKFAPSVKALAKGKRLRGTRFDPFGRTDMRRMERQLVDDFEAMIQQVCVTEGLVADADRLSTAITLAELPDMVRGYEELKVTRVEEYRRQAKELMARFKQSIA